MEALKKLLENLAKQFRQVIRGNEGMLDVNVQEAVKGEQVEPQQRLKRPRVDRSDDSGEKSFSEVYGRKRQQREESKDD